MDPYDAGEVKDVVNIPQDHKAHLSGSPPAITRPAEKAPVQIDAEETAPAVITLPESSPDIAGKKVLSEKDIEPAEDIFTPVREKALFPEKSQASMNEDYNRIFFSVWHHLQPFHSSPDKIALLFNKFSSNPGYGENKRKHSQAWLRKLRQNAALEHFPNTLKPAITTRSTNLRMLPTQRPHFNRPVGNIDSWPFDNLQISSVAANTPILVCHISADKSWALIETNFAFGWIPVEDFARVSDDFIKTWECGRYAAGTKDKSFIYDENGFFMLRSSIGQIFPLMKETGGNLEILIAVADENNNAVIKHGVVSRQIAEIKPLPFTYDNVIKIANEMMDEPYGWGGMYGNRDCSAMTRDFFAPFGMWLPRHSEDQVKTVGNYIDLRHMTPEEKEKIIIEQGIPYLTLLWRKGHIMLYIGAENGQAHIFHNVWGLRTVDLCGREGRKIIGKAVITTLSPGAELYFVPRENLLLNTIAAMSILAPVKQNPQPPVER